MKKIDIKGPVRKMIIHVGTPAIQNFVGSNCYCHSVYSQLKISSIQFHLPLIQLYLALIHNI